MTGPGSMLERFEAVFHGDGFDYDITMSHVALSGQRVIGYHGGGKYHLIQRNAGGVWTAEHENQDAAVLLLIAARLGYVGELRPAPEDGG